MFWRYRAPTKRPRHRPLDHQLQIDRVVRQVQEIDHAEGRLKFLRKHPGVHDEWFELIEDIVALRTYAISWFMQGDDSLKRMIFKTTGSNSTLTAKKLTTYAAKPFVPLSDFPDFILECPL